MKTKTTKGIPKNPKMETLVNFILDKSGSMSSIEGATTGGFNEYLNSLKKDGNKYSFSLTLFDTKVSKPYVNQPISKIIELDKKSYVPDGMTALYDAVCQTIKEVRGTVKKNQKVLTVIMTDGAENSSQEYSQQNLKDLVQELEKTGLWSFVFLGANQDSYATAGAVGISVNNTANYVPDSHGTLNAFASVSRGTSAFSMSAQSATSNFFVDNSLNTSASTPDGIGQSSFTASSPSQNELISNHFSSLGKKSWDSRRKKILGE